MVESLTRDALPSCSDILLQAFNKPGLKAEPLIAMFVHGAKRRSFTMKA